MKAQRATVGESRQAMSAGGSHCGGRRFAPTPLRCSLWGRAAELAAFASLSTLKQLRRVSLRSALTRADPSAALLAATEFTPDGHRLPRGDTLPPHPSRERAGVRGALRRGTRRPCKGACGQPVARLRGAEKRSARGVRAKRASSSSSSQLFERRERRSERSEFCDASHATEHRREVGTQCRPPW